MEKKQTKSIAKELFSQNLTFIIGILCTSFTSSLLNSLGLTLLVPILFKIFEMNSITSMPISLSKYFDSYLAWLPGNKSIWLLVFVLLLFLLKNTLIMLRIHLLGRLSKKQLLALRTDTLRHILKSNFHYFVYNGSGTLLNHLTTSVEKTSKFIIDVVETLGMTFQLLAYVIVLAYISFKLSLVVLLYAIPIMAVTKAIARAAKKLSVQQSHSHSSLAQSLNDLLHGIRFVKLANRESDHLEHIENESAEIVTRLNKMVFFSMIGQPVTELSGLILLVSLTAFVSYGGAEVVSMASFLSFLIILTRALPLFNAISTKRIEVAANAGSVTELEKVLSDNSYEVLPTGTRRFSKLKEVVFENVSFAYPGSSTNVLNDISFSLKQGESIAVVGPSGSGKSTLVDLIMNFYQPTKGSILFDGVNYLDFDLKSYRKRIGLVPQESILFFSTIRENLLYLNPRASEIEIWRALDQADIAQFISDLPEGLDSRVGERGIRLSGGQKQRLSIARTLLQNPEILIFDEATSSLDSLSEARIVDSLKRVSQGRTTITIAHRLATVLHCHKVLLIEQGWLVEQGELQHLLKTNSRFRRYAENQNLKLVA